MPGRMEPSLANPPLTLLVLPLLPLLWLGYSVGSDDLGAYPCFEGVKLHSNRTSLVASEQKSTSANIQMQGPGEYTINAPTASSAARGCASLCQGAKSAGCDVFITFPAPPDAAAGFSWGCVLLRAAFLRKNITDFDTRVPQSYSCTLSDTTFKAWGDFYGKVARNAQSGQPIFCAPFTNVNANNTGERGGVLTAANCFENCTDPCTVISFLHFRNSPTLSHCDFRNEPNGDGKGHKGEGDTGLFNSETFVDGITCYKKEDDLLRVGQLLSASNARTYVYKGTRYNLYPDKVNKTTAERACKAAGGQLASINPEDQQLMNELNDNLLSYLAPQHKDGCAGARRMAFIALQQKPAGTTGGQPTYVMGEGATAKSYTADQLSSVLDTSISPEVRKDQKATAGVLQTCQNREKEPKVHFALVDGAKTCCVAAFICTGPEPPLFLSAVQPPAESQPQKGVNVGLIVGVAVGAAVGVAILVVGGLWLNRHLKKKKQDKKWDDVLKT